MQDSRGSHQAPASRKYNLHWVENELLLSDITCGGLAEAGKGNGGGVEELEQRADSGTKKVL